MSKILLNGKLQQITGLDKPSTINLICSWIINLCCYFTRKLIKFLQKIKLYEGITGSFDIKIIYMITLMIEQSFYIFLIFTNNIDEIMFVQINFLIFMIYQITGNNIYFLIAFTVIDLIN